MNLVEDVSSGSGDDEFGDFEECDVGLKDTAGDSKIVPENEPQNSAIVDGGSAQKGVSEQLIYQPASKSTDPTCASSNAAPSASSATPPCQISADETIPIDSPLSSENAVPLSVKDTCASEQPNLNIVPGGYKPALDFLDAEPSSDEITASSSNGMRNHSDTTLQNIDAEESTESINGHKNLNELQFMNGDLLRKSDDSVLVANSFDSDSPGPGETHVPVPDVHDESVNPNLTAEPSEDPFGELESYDTRAFASDAPAINPIENGYDSCGLTETVVNTPSPCKDDDLLGGFDSHAVSTHVSNHLVDTEPGAPVHEPLAVEVNVNPGNIVHVATDLDAGNTDAGFRDFDSKSNQVNENAAQIPNPTEIGNGDIGSKSLDQPPPIIRGSMEATTSAQSHGVSSEDVVAVDGGFGDLDSPTHFNGTEDGDNRFVGNFDGNALDSGSDERIILPASGDSSQAEHVSVPLKDTDANFGECDTHVADSADADGFRDFCSAGLDAKDEVDLAGEVGVSSESLPNRAIDTNAQIWVESADSSQAQGASNGTDNDFGGGYDDGFGNFDAATASSKTIDAEQAGMGEDFGDFDSPQYADAAGSNGDKAFGDFKSPESGSKVEPAGPDETVGFGDCNAPDPQASNPAAANDNDDDFGDFGEAMQAHNDDKTSNPAAANDNDDDFGDFGEATQAHNDDTTDPQASNPAAANDDNDDDFGDFGEATQAHNDDISGGSRNASHDENNNDCGDFDDVKQDPHDFSVWRNDSILQCLKERFPGLFPTDGMVVNPETDNFVEPPAKTVTEILANLSQEDETGRESSHCAKPDLAEVEVSGDDYVSLVINEVKSEPFLSLHYPFGGLISSVVENDHFAISEKRGKGLPGVVVTNLPEDLTVAPLSPSRSPKRSSSSPPSTAAIDPPMLPALQHKDSSTKKSSPRNFLKRIPNLSFMLSSKLSLPNDS